MIRIEKIPRITPDEIKALRSQGIRSVADLWHHLGQDLDGGIDSLVEHSGLEKIRLVELLKSLALSEAIRKGSWAGRHWLELVLLGVLLLILALILYARTAVAA